MPRAGWLLVVALVGCRSVSAEKPADPDRPRPDRFGPTPDRVELTPARSTVAAGRDVLLIASVFDAAGEARRNRRVEWSLTGPGEIMAVADSGWLPGRSGKKTTTSAVSYTELYDRSAKRGDGATTAVKAGQAWCRVRGGTDETVVTARVPDIPDSSKRSATAILSPADGTSPPPLEPAPIIPLDRPKARPEPTADRLPREDDGRKSRDREATPTGRAARPAVLTLDTSAPSAVGLGQTATVILTASNRGGTTASAVNLLARLPDGLELVSSDPPPAVRQGPDEKDLRWGLGELSAGGTADRVALTVRPTRRGEHRIRAAVESGDTQRDDRDIPVTADDAGIGVSLEVPPTAAEGDRVPVTVIVTNTGGVPVRNAVAFVTAGPELMSDLSPKELSVGTIAAGETRRVTARLTAVRAGRPSVRATVTADGGLVQPARGEVIVTASGERERSGEQRRGGAEEKSTDTGSGVASSAPRSSAPPPPVGRPALVMEVVDPPGKVASGDTVRVRIKVRNRGTATATSVDVSAAGEGSLSAVGGVGADRRKASADAGRVQFPTLPEIKPGTVAVFEVELKAGDAGSGRLSAAVRAEYLRRPLKEEHEARVVER